ncbi:hypothetical protein [Clostridium sp. BNL1100]|uniref:hypothetical protein n=1 Tax=Clostridium sp. BNL1100 TaxID=755731 RepID=UPI00024A7874|nr:hypothetical protein [Clostridium sp. BNL1100]AEY67852.1 hypothetical protein Clo1100_3734 [Clostridium sp. BNL1100]
MFYGKEKKVIVLRDIHSNLFEEAILVMKQDAQSGDNEKKQQSEGGSVYNNKFILREAEAIINNYVKENKGNLATVPKERQKSACKKHLNRKFNESRFMKILIINSALIGSIAAIAYILIEIF